MRAKLQQFLNSNRLARPVMMLMGGTALAQLLTLGSMPLVTRLYTPEMIGIISIYLSFFNFWSALLSWRYEGALLVARDENESHHVFRLGILLVFLTGLLGGPVLWLLQSYKAFSFAELPQWAPYIATLSLLGYGSFMMYRSWSLRLGEVGPIGRSTVFRSAANVSVRLGGGVASGGVMGLFIAEVAGSWAAVITLRGKVLRQLTQPSPGWDWPAFKHAALRYKKFPQYELPSVLLNQCSAVVPVPMVGALYGAEAAGWFGLARLLVAMPNMQIGNAVSDVFQMELARHWRDGELAKGRRLFYNLLKKMAQIGVLPLLASVLIAPFVVPYIFGADWRPMGYIVALMAPWMYAALIVSTLSRLLSVLQAQHLKLAYDLFALVMVVSVYLFSRAESLELYSFLALLSGGFVLSYLVYGLLLTFVVQTRLKG